MYSNTLSARFLSWTNSNGFFYFTTPQNNESFTEIRPVLFIDLIGSHTFRDEKDRNGKQKLLNEWKMKIWVINEWKFQTLFWKTNWFMNSHK